MKVRLKFFLLFALSLFLLAFSQQKELAEKEPKTSLLWKIEGNGLREPSYLFGTMHLIQKEYFYFPSSLEKILKKSDLLLMELSAEELNDQTASMNLLTLKEGELMDYFNEGQQDTLLKWANQKLHMDKNTFLAMFSKFKPFVVVQTAVQLEFFGKTESYELKLMEIASRNKIPSAGLESMSDQIGLFDRMGKEQQAEMVMENIRNEEKSKTEMLHLQGVYFRQNLDSLYLLIHDDKGVIAEEEAVFLSDRNKNWIPKISSSISKGKTFIAVGAGHLGGENGVIGLLRKEGYILTPVKF